MSVRIMLSPPVEVSPGAYIAYAEQYCDIGHINIWATDATNTPVGNWLITVGVATDWTAAAADAQITILFTFPASADTLAKAKQWLRTTTVGDLTAGQRTTLQNRFDAKGIPRADFTLSTTLAKVFRRAIGFLLESDEQFGFAYSINGDG